MTSSGDGDGDPGDGDPGDGDPGDGDPGDGDPGDGDPGDGDPGDGDPGDGDGDSCPAGQMLCGGICVDTATDAANCGMCGHVCDIKDNVGGCIEGECAPTLSECVTSEDPPASCDEVCMGEGKICVSDGCYGQTTFVWYAFGSDCANFQGSHVGGPCTFPNIAETNHYRCCCGEP
ncbi:Flagelliform silk protein [Enhygromyxa salina]|uniref:Flagelliform silk protein n=1 Tax=Enhygromyxa salina TaxID=215803 RepID=A0A0C2CUG3_9BACT|nr:Flagelliform silk protein [Enhygromyxa salina]